MEEKVSRAYQSEVEKILPYHQMTLLSLQHVLAMYASAVSIPLIIGSGIGLTQSQIAILIAADLFTCGIATILQAFGFKNILGLKLPVLLGCAFTVITPLISIGKDYGIGAIYGSIIVAGLFAVLFAPVFGKMLKLFPAVVTGSIVVVIGLSVMPIAVNYAAGGYGVEDWGSPMHFLMSGLVIVVILIANRFFKGFMQSISVLIGLIVGTLVSAGFGLVNLSEVAAAGWVSIVKPFALSTPKFMLFPSLMMIIVVLVNMVESTGVFFAIGEICGKEIKEKDIVKGLRAEGVATIVGGILNSYPYSTYSENVGLVSLTGVKSRHVVGLAGIMLLFLGILPKFAALALAIPTDVLGGAMIVMFAMVGVAGINMISKADLRNDNGNMLTATLAVGIGLGAGIVPGLFDKTPELIKVLFGSNGIVCATLVGVLVNLLFKHKEIFSKDKPQANQAVGQNTD